MCAGCAFSAFYMYIRTEIGSTLVSLKGKFVQYLYIIFSKWYFYHLLLRKNYILNLSFSIYRGKGDRNDEQKVTLFVKVLCLKFAKYNYFQKICIH